MRMSMSICIIFKALRENLDRAELEECERLGIVPEILQLREEMELLEPAVERIRKAVRADRARVLEEMAEYELQAERRP